MGTPNILSSLPTTKIESGQHALGAADHTVTFTYAHRNLKMWLSVGAAATAVTFNGVAAVLATHAVVDDALVIKLEGLQHPISSFRMISAAATGSIYWLAY